MTQKIIGRGAEAVLKKKGNMSRDEICEEFGFKKKTIVQI